MQHPKQEEQNHEKNKDKTYIGSKKKWKDFKLHQQIIDVLTEQGLLKPTRVQQETLEITTNLDRKKYNLLIRAANGSGKTYCLLLPMLNSLKSHLKIVDDKIFKGVVHKDQIFMPQGIIIVPGNILQQQIEKILVQIKQYGISNKLQKIIFDIGRMDGQKHQHGDLIVCVVDSFLNRYKRGNMKLTNCKFVAIDQVDDIFDHDAQKLQDLLKITQSQTATTTNVICCSATMKKQFLEFFDKNVKEYISSNLNQQLQKQLKEKITLQGVLNYYRLMQTTEQMHKYIIKVIFKHLYSAKEGKKPQVFIFFNSAAEIQKFDQFFQSISTDLTSDQHEYLSNLKRGKLSGFKYQNNNRVKMPIEEKRQIMSKFSNNQTNVLLSTNIIARGIDTRNVCFVINVGAPKKDFKDQNIDLDLYLHRVGRTGRHNDHGVSLTLLEKKYVGILQEGIKKIHKIDLINMESPQQIVKDVQNAIHANSV